MSDITQWNSATNRLRQIERRLQEFGSLAKGQITVQADRDADLADQIDELRTELQRQGEELKQGLDKLDKVAEYVKKHVPRKENSNGSGSG